MYIYIQVVSSKIYVYDATVLPLAALLLFSGDLNFNLKRRQGKLLGRLLLTSLSTNTNIHIVFYQLFMIRM